MKTAILGTGHVGRTIAARLAELGHTVTVGTRDPEATLARTGTDAMGTAPFAAWAAENAGITVASFRDAAAGAELIVTACPRPCSSRTPIPSASRSSALSPPPAS